MAATAPKLDRHKIQEFFNDIELQEGGAADLELLVEAEARGLLDPITQALLEEGRARGFIKPRPRLATTAAYSFEVRIIAISGRQRAEPSQAQLEMQLSALVEDAKRRESLAAERVLTLTLDMGGIHIAKQSGAPRGAPQGNQVQPAGAAQPQAKSEVVMDKAYAMVHSIMTFDKHVVLCLKADVEGSTDEVDSYVLRATDKKRATELAKAVQTHLSALQQLRSQQHSANGQREYPVRRIVITRSASTGGFGFSYVGAIDALTEDQGLYVTTVAPTGPAAGTDLVEGLQILRVNGQDLINATTAEMRRVLAAAGATLVLEARENPAGYAPYERQLGRNRPELQYQGRELSAAQKADAELNDDGDADDHHGGSVAAAAARRAFMSPIAEEEATGAPAPMSPRLRSKPPSSLPTQQHQQHQQPQQRDSAYDRELDSMLGRLTMAAGFVPTTATSASTAKPKAADLLMY